MEGFGFDKLLLILVIVLVLFGARRVPEIGASIGKGIREFKRGMHDLNPEAEDDANRSKRIASPAEPSERTDVEPKRLLER
jgi:sec-independent protein translocase protein TatA